MKKKCNYGQKSLLTFFAVMVFILGMSSYVLGAERQSVRVGFFDFPGYHDISKEGKLSGYGYEYIHEISKYTNWQYEYVFEDYETCLDLLEKGQIDMVTSVSYTPERAARFDYSKNNMGIKNTILTVKNDNTDYAIGEYENLDGIVVGMLKDNTSNENLKDFSKEKGFSYTARDDYAEIDQLQAALEDGTVDAILTSNLRTLNHEKIIAEFAPSPYYAVVKKGDTALLQQIDKALETINIDNPTFQSNLYRQYYGNFSVKSVAFAKEELDYLEGQRSVEIAFAPNLQPLVYEENGVCKGIAPDILEKALSPSGLNLNMIAFDTEKEYQAYINSHDSVILGIENDDIYEAEQKGLQLTSHYLTLTYSNVSLQADSHNDDVKIATLKNSVFTKEYVEKVYPPEEILYCDSLSQCLEKVTKHEAKSTILNTYNAEFAVNNNMKDRLSSRIVLGYTSDIAVGVSQSADPALFSIINKCINSLNKEDSDTIIAKYTNDTHPDFSLKTFFYQYPMSVLFILMLFFALIMVFGYFIMAQVRIRRERLWMSESAKFAALVAKSNGEFDELNLEEKILTEHTFKDNKLEKRSIHLKKDSDYLQERESLVHEDDIEKYRSVFAYENLIAIAKSQSEVNSEFRLYNEKGESHWFLFTILGLPDDHNHPCNIMVFRKDIHELKESEQRKRRQLEDALASAKVANQAKGAFMSKVSHEIRTPLNAIIGYLSISISHFENREKVSDCICKSQVAAKHLLGIINDVLDMSSIESGKMKIAQNSFHFRQTIASVSQMFYTIAEEKGVQFQTILNHVTYEYFIGDELRLNQILMNLLSNAVKFTPQEGSVTFKISQNLLNDDRVLMHFEITDTGIGMEPKFMERLFSPFEQQDAQIAQRFGGTGLGLSITKNLVDMMHGAISVKSEPGKGATFTVELAFALDKTYHNNSEERADFSDVHALLVDDQADTCEYMLDLMDRCHIRSEVAIGGEAAVEMVKKSIKKDDPYNICIIDWKMPGMDGLATAKAIRKLVPGDSPIVIISAYDYSAIEEEAKSIGVSFFVSKPMFHSTILDLLVNVYGKYHRVQDVVEEIPDFSSKRLLLVEDNPMNQEIAHDILSEMKITVDTAGDGQEAQDIFLASKPGTYDLIFMDIQMPKVNGYQATAFIRKASHPQSQTIPIIAMTANAFDEDVAMAFASGMNGHIAKPIDISILQNILKDFL